MFKFKQMCDIITLKETVSYDERKRIFHTITQKHPDRIPVIIEPHSCMDPKISQKKYLVNNNLYLETLFDNAMKHMNHPNGVINFYIKNKCPIYHYLNNDINSSTYKLISPNDSLKTLYQNHKDRDGFLYIVYAYK